jgi:hypothetical protein
MVIRNLKSSAKILFIDIRNIGGRRVVAFLPRKHGFAARSALVGFVVEKKAGFEPRSVSVLCFPC